MPVKNFSQYLIEEDRAVFFTYGRMNPPTIGHGKVMDTLSTKAGKMDYKVFLSQTQDAKKNPLSYSDKVKHVRKMFPKHARNIMVDKNIKTAFDALVSLYDQGYTKINMVVGSDRVREFQVLFDKYNGETARHGFYKFKSINIISAGERDPDADGVEGMSASKQRENAKGNDFVSFSQGVPKAMSNADARKLFNDVRKGMGLSETTEFRNHISLEPISEEREAFVRGELFSIGDDVVIKESDELGKIVQLGANYVIIESNGKTLRKWFTAVEKLEEALGKSDPIEKWIRDFIDSDAPQFKGKSKEQRIDMAKGAYYASQKESCCGAGEEGTDELVKKYKKDTPKESLKSFKEVAEKNGLWDNIHKKRARIKAGSGEKMRKPGSKGAPSADDFKSASKED